MSTESERLCGYEKKMEEKRRGEEEKKEIKDRSEWGECVVGGKVGSSGETSCENLESLIIILFVIF